MLVKMFVLGRPGCGKTTAVCHILKLMSMWGYEMRRKKDYNILYKMFQEDQKNANYSRFCVTEHGGFDVLDFSVLDEALKRLEEEVQREIIEAEKPGIIIIEFARSNYREALHNFSSDFLRDAYFFFVDADLDTCIQRIHQRVTSPPKPDCHFVSDHIMRTYYKESKDDWRYMSDEVQSLYALPKKAIRLYYNMGRVTELLACATDFVESIFKKEPSDAWGENVSLPVTVSVGSSEIENTSALMPI